MYRRRYACDRTYNYMRALGFRYQTLATETHTRCFHSDISQKYFARWQLRQEQPGAVGLNLVVVIIFGSASDVDKDVLKPDRAQHYTYQHQNNQGNNRMITL